MITARSWNDSLLLPTLFGQVQWTRAHWAIQTLAPKNNYSRSSWFLSIYFSFCGPADTPQWGITPLQSTWSSRSWSNWMQSLSSKIWLLSEVPDFCQHNSIPSPSPLGRLSTQPSETASRETEWLDPRGSMQCHMRLNSLHIKNQESIVETLKSSTSGEQRGFWGRQLSILF